MIYSERVQRIGPFEFLSVQGALGCKMPSDSYKVEPYDVSCLITHNHPSTVITARFNNLRSMPVSSIFTCFKPPKSRPPVIDPSASASSPHPTEITQRSRDGDRAELYEISYFANPTFENNNDKVDGPAWTLQGDPRKGVMTLVHGPGGVLKRQCTSIWVPKLKDDDGDARSREGDTQYHLTELDVCEEGFTCNTGHLVWKSKDGTTHHAITYGTSAKVVKVNH